MTIIINDIYGVFAVLIVMIAWISKTIMEWRIQAAMAAKRRADVENMAAQAQVAMVLGERHADAIGTKD